MVAIASARRRHTCAAARRVGEFGFAPMLQARGPCRSRSDRATSPRRELRRSRIRNAVLACWRESSCRGAERTRERIALNFDGYLLADTRLGLLCAFGGGFRDRACRAARMVESIGECAARRWRGA